MLGAERLAGVAALRFKGRFKSLVEIMLSTRQCWQLGLAGIQLSFVPNVPS